MTAKNENYHYLLGRIEEAIETFEKQISFARANLMLAEDEPTKLVYHAMIKEKTAALKTLKLIIGQEESEEES